MLLGDRRWSNRFERVNQSAPDTTIEALALGCDYLRNLGNISPSLTLRVRSDA
jgi:hypothetical protein